MKKVLLFVLAIIMVALAFAIIVEVMPYWANIVAFTAIIGIAFIIYDNYNK